MLEHPGDYAWSSYRCHVYNESNRIITDHVTYKDLSPTDESRNTAHRALLTTALSTTQIHEIRAAAHFSMSLGDSRFKAQIEQTLKRSVGSTGRGRLRKTQQHGKS